MGVSLAFHIVFAAIGVALPLFMTIAEWRHQRTGDPVWRELARRWSKGTAILFAVGAVSGTVLSFELGLLWPEFMAVWGSVIGFPFALEGFAFFTEAIFLGIWLYGWDRVPPRFHLFAGAVVAASGAASAFFVTLANVWMNSPVGFTPGPGGMPLDPDPVAAMFAPGWAEEVTHVLLSSYQATAFAMAGVHALLILRGRTSEIHRRALALTLTVGGVCALLQPISGDFSARSVARKQPAKLAALEGQFETERGAPLRIGGMPDVERRETRFAIEIPHGLSLLAFHDPNAEVRGLDQVPREDWPDVRTVHVCFQIMVACGVAMVAVSLASAWAWRKGKLTHPLLLKAIVAVSPLGFVAIEAGWMVTEKGRQPWIVQSVMRTSDAATEMPGLAITFWATVAVYLFLGAVSAWLLTRLIEETRG